MMINYEVSFLSEENRLAGEKSGGVVAALDQMSKACHGDEACSTLEMARITREAMDKGTLPAVSWEKIVEHIDHAAKVAGVDHVGLGSDFDAPRCRSAWKTPRSCPSSRQRSWPRATPPRTWRRSGRQHPPCDGAGRTGSRAALRWTPTAAHLRRPADLSVEGTSTTSNPSLRAAAANCSSSVTISE